MLSHVLVQLNTYWIALQNINRKIFSFHVQILRKFDQSKIFFDSNASGLGPMLKKFECKEKLTSNDSIIWILCPLWNAEKWIPNISIIIDCKKPVKCWMLRFNLIYWKFLLICFPKFMQNRTFSSISWSGNTGMFLLNQLFCSSS